jgi:hypothetical protein
MECLRNEWVGLKIRRVSGISAQNEQPLSENNNEVFEAVTQPANEGEGQ